MRTGIAIISAVLVAANALADCPGTTCVAGGGPAATDCFVAFSGISSTTVSCTDGDPSCDTDGKADGVCTLGLQACVNVSGLPSCTPGSLGGPPSVTPSKDPAAQQLAAALRTLPLTGQSCTAPGIKIPLRVSLAGIKAGKSRLTVTASSGGKTDRDKLRLTCLASKVAPSFSADVQPIFTHTCATSSCHDASNSLGFALTPGRAYADMVGAHSAEVPNLLRVKPGSIRGSFLARKILGQGIPRGTGGGMMPQGCPTVQPPGGGGCPTADEIFTILSWIANGAPEN
jgi:hypothetical protein